MYRKGGRLHPCHAGGGAHLQRGVLCQPPRVSRHVHRSAGVEHLEYQEVNIDCRDSIETECLSQTCQCTPSLCATGLSGGCSRKDPTILFSDEITQGLDMF